MTLEAALGQALSGISLGMVWFLIAAGLSIIFGTLKILNMAHGSIYMLGGFLCYQVTSTFSHIPGVFWLALLVAPLVTALVGGGIVILLLRRIYGLDMIYQYLLTFGLILIVADVCKLIWGVGYNTVAVPWPLKDTVSLFGLSFPKYNLFLIGMGILVFVGLRALIGATSLGGIVRAVTHNREIANALGINVPSSLHRSLHARVLAGRAGGHLDASHVRGGARGRRIGDYRLLHHCGNRRTGEHTRRFLRGDHPGFHHGFWALHHPQTGSGLRLHSDDHCPDYSSAEG